MIAISFYNSRINPEIVKYQKKVFDHFGIGLSQQEYPISATHAGAIDWWLGYRWIDYNYDHVAIFDIDCIPLHDDVLSSASEMVDKNILYGAVQKANHIPQSDVYCSPAFCCFSRRMYSAANMPSFSETANEDVGGHFTREMMFCRFGHHLLWPSHVENPMWNLTESRKFGYGTTYDNTVYHAFESRFNHESTSRFIAKCKEILGEA